MQPRVAEPLHRRLWLLSRGVARGLFLHHAFDHAATMAFYFFLGMIPLLVIAGLLVGRVLQAEGGDVLWGPLYRALPKIASDFLRHDLYRPGDVPALAPLSVVGFLWLTTNGVHNLMDVFELLVQARPRPWWKQRLISVLWVVAGLATLVAVTWVVLLANAAASGLSKHNFPVLLWRISDYLTLGWRRAGVLLLFVALSSGGLALFYRSAVVHPRLVKRRVWAGTFVALLLWVLVSWVFGRYVGSIGDYTVYYGSLATVAVILLWLYLTSLALLVGAEVNAHLEGTRHPSGAALPRG